MDIVGGFTENWASIVFTDEEKMPNQAERLAKLEGSTTLIGYVIMVLVPSLLFWGWYITSNVIAIKQQLADGGNKQIVAQLHSPQSSEKLRAALSTVIAQVQTSRADGQKPNPVKIGALSRALSQVVKKDPELPEAWQAAAELISYDTSYPSAVRVPPDLGTQIRPAPVSGSCYDLPTVQEGPHPTGTSSTDTMVLHDCILDLSDLEAFEGSEQVKAMKATTLGWRGAVVIVLDLVRVKVTYHGGAVIPVTLIQTYGCQFDFDVSTPPPPRGKALLEALLSTDLSRSDVAVQLPAAA